MLVKELATQTQDQCSPCFTTCHEKQVLTGNEPPGVLFLYCVTQVVIFVKIYVIAFRCIVFSEFFGMVENANCHTLFKTNSDQIRSSNLTYGL